METSQIGRWHDGALARANSPGRASLPPSDDTMLFHEGFLCRPREELGLAQGFVGKLRGYLPNRWPTWFVPRSINFVREPLGPFDRSHLLASHGKVVVVPTPGHTPGHVSVIVVIGDVCYFLAGDTTYIQQALIHGQVDGVSPDERVSFGTMQTISRLTEERPTAYLPTQDPESTHRLEIRASVPVDE